MDPNSKVSKMSNPLDFDVQIIPLVPQVDPGIFNCGDSFDISLVIAVHGSQSFSHKGIYFEFVSELYPEKGKPISLATPVSVQLVESGTLSGSMECQLPQVTIPANVQTYHGELFSIKHILRFIVKKGFGAIEHTKEIIAYSYSPSVTKIQPLCVRVAVAENIRVDLLISRRKFEINDVLLGGAHFLLVALKIVKFTVSLVSQEILDIGGKTKKHTNTIFEWEITDGAPVKGEIVPFRLFLAPLNVSPSVVDQTKGYSASHFLHFYIHTTSGTRYFKAIQIKLGKWNSLPFAFSENSTVTPLTEKKK